MNCINYITVSKGIHVPCGKCEFCLKRKRSEWLMRLEHEADVSCSSLFITLTYNDQNVPITYEGRQSLFKRDLTNFLKRLRYYHTKRRKSLKTQGNRSMKYFAIGEYGSDTFRPHYHVLLFHAENLTREEIDKTWYYGFTKIDPVSKKRINYITKYMITDSDKTYDDINAQFMVSSQELGIDYVNQRAEYHRKSGKDYIIKNGKNLRLPRYYMHKIYSKGERLMKAHEELKKADKFHEEQIEDLEKRGYNPYEIRQLQTEQTRKIIKKSIQKNKLI